MASVALDELEPLSAQVGWGGLGCHGELGYEGGAVVVGCRRYGSALSTHPPARVRFAVPAGARRFRAAVAINDDVAGCGSHADFSVLVDGRVAAEAPHVRGGSGPVDLVARVEGAAEVELLVSTAVWAYCHAVWLEPTFDDHAFDEHGQGHGHAGDAEGGPEGTVVAVTDPLERADMVAPTGLSPVARCIATVGSAGFEGWLDDMLGSVRANGRCPDALLVVLALDDAPTVHEVAEHHGAVVVRCRLRRHVDPTAKAVLYSVGSLVPASRFVCLDADMLVLDDLGPLFAAIDACTPGTVLVCGEGNDHGIPDLRTALDVAYGGGADPPFFARSSPVAAAPLVVNDGLLAGSRAAFLALEREVRSLPGVVGWVDERPDIRWRNQFAVNVALVQSGAAVELDPTWNVQLHAQDVEVDGGCVRWRERDVRVLHFSGLGKLRHGELRATTRLGSQLAALAADGRFEEATTVGDQLAERGPLHPAAAERLSWLSATMAPPAVGSTAIGERSWASAVPRDLLADIQQGVHHQRYRGRQLVKSPFDLAMYQQLLERERPATIVEIGSKEGGSALWLADVARALGLDCTVHSYDIHPVTGGVEGADDPDGVGHPGVQFSWGDGRQLDTAISADELASWPRPWLVIDDADHTEPTTAGLLEFFHPHLRPGDLVVVEDGNLSDLYPELYPDHSSGPHVALRRFLARWGLAYEVAADLCDLFGHNTTTASNGILRRRPDPVAAPTPTPAAAPTATAVPAAARLEDRPWRQVEAPPEVLAVPTMLSVQERQLLYWLARHHVRGDGRIVDGGCFLGGSTAALAAGLAARDDLGPPSPRIASYDRFVVEDYTLADYGSSFPDPRPGASFRPAFDANIAPWAGWVEVREGDATAVGWTGEPIEVLFLDLVKTWELNDLVLDQFLPCLVPGHSVIVQQDYLWGYGPWIHMTMELLHDSVRQLDAMPNGSVAYLLVDEVPASLVGARLRHDIPPERQRALMDRAVARWQGADRAMLELARILLVVELDGPEAAADHWESFRRRGYPPSPAVAHAATNLASYLGFPPLVHQR